MWKLAVWLLMHVNRPAPLPLGLSAWMPVLPLRKASYRFQIHICKTQQQQQQQQQQQYSAVSNDDIVSASCSSRQNAKVLQRCHCQQAAGCTRSEVT
jgi:hypothetical protein